MSEYSKLVEEFFTRYETPEIEELVVGFSGIDPQKIVSSSEINHELLNNLLGGDENGHYHLTQEQLEELIDIISMKYLPEIMSGQQFFTEADKNIFPYQVTGDNVTLTQ